MIQRLTYTQLVIAGTTVASGLVLGLLFLSRHKRKSGRSTTNHVTEIADWVDTKGRDITVKNPGPMRHLRSSARRRIKQYIPDLYEATDHINLSEPYIANA